MEELDSSRIPTHVAIIMDGNGRWAAQRGLPRLAGHDAGTENIRRITFKAGELGIRYLTLWAFSTENWRRPRDEVEGIMKILAKAIESETEELHRQGAQLRHIGDLAALEPELQQAVRDAIHLTRNNDRLVLTLAFNYGGRQEILQAIKEIVADGVAPGEIDEELVDRHLFTRGTPDPDLVIRTSGECRMSTFLLWPDFGPAELEAAVRDYGRRERRFGHISAPAAISLD
jgi:undecaprenyl diphosphate synthase